MEKDKLKISLLEKIIKCDDAATLKRVEELFLNVSEAGEEYLLRDPVPESHYKDIEEDFRKYQKGEIEATSWEELKKELKSKNGL